ncbi:MAG: hypothetical protein N4A46_12150 [Schleiferiaceae bacterium]|jgi:hypothetical protein|nr:hypothetical protein [Schleiferiaceae bacterium]
MTIALIAFVILEFLNVIILYFFPQTKKGNGVGVFNAFEKSKQDPEVHVFIMYLINWIAGTKLIFIALLIVILALGERELKLLSIAVLIPSIATFYWRLFPMIKKMDRNDQILPKGYSKTLGAMITGFLVVFISVLVYNLLKD